MNPPGRLLSHGRILDEWIEISGKEALIKDRASFQRRSIPELLKKKTSKS